MSEKYVMTVTFAAVIAIVVLVALMSMRRHRVHNPGKIQKLKMGSNKRIMRAEDSRLDNYPYF